jgi:hypothetical protein
VSPEKTEKTTQPKEPRRIEIDDTPEAAGASPSDMRRQVEDLQAELERLKKQS